MDKKLQEIIKIHEERQLAMQVLSEQLGIDISFSDEETKKFIEEAYAKHLESKIVEEVEKWTKSALS